MSLVRLVGFTTLACGCLVGKYREVATSRELSYIEEKGRTCRAHGHVRNHPVRDESMRQAAGSAVRGPSHSSSPAPLLSPSRARR